MSPNDFAHAVLPHAALLPWWVQLSWAVVMSALVLRLSVWRRVGPAAVVAVVMLALPAASGYVALAFQTPSLVLLVWALGCWWQAWRLTRQGKVAFAAPTSALQTHQAKPTDSRALWAYALGALLGWALVLDTLNYWPAFFNPQLYAWGFTSASLWSVLTLAALGFVWQAKREGPSALACPPLALSALIVLALYVLLRLPTGNVWDALLDPFVWLACHVQLGRAWRAARAHRAARAQGGRKDQDATQRSAR